MAEVPTPDKTELIKPAGGSGDSIKVEFDPIDVDESGSGKEKAIEDPEALNNRRIEELAKENEELRARMEKLGKAMNLLVRQLDDKGTIETRLASALFERGDLNKYN
jgi:hypothetical protein